MNKNLKKVISATAALAMSASSLVAVTAQTFPDVPETASYAQAVNELSVLGIINGYEDGTFGPENNVTRAEFAKMTVGALGTDYITSAESKTGQDTQFTDVPGTHWAAGWVKEGTDYGFINGYSATEFGPDDNVTYAQAVKMLVCAVGYDYYSQQLGGWPAGYLQYGVTLGITSGVKAGTDEVITRAQVAQLIDNALKAPICVITGYSTGTWGNTEPDYEKKDKASTSVEDSWESLLDYGHKVYDVYGRVTGTLQSGGVTQSDKVRIDVEKSNNFDGLQVKAGTNADLYKDQIVYIGGSDANNYLFTYSEMLIAKDENDDFTILTIYPQGTNTEETFAASDYDDAKSDMNNMYAFRNGKDSKSTSYKLDKDNIMQNAAATGGGGFYVNEKSVDINSEDDYNDAITRYVLDNGTGNITLIDSPLPGKSSADGKFDYVKVTKYGTAIVDSVRIDSDTETTVYFDNMSSGMDAQWDVDTDDDSLYYSITLDGEKISAADLQEGDVISIAYDLLEGFGDSSTYTAVVSRNTVQGTVQSISPDDDPYDYEYTLSDGEIYTIADADLISASSDIESGEEYTMYLDAFGNIAKVDQEATSKLIGVIDSVYVSNGDQYYANVFTKNGDKIQANIKNDTRFNQYYALVYDRVNGVDVKKPITDRVYNYKLNSSNEITINDKEDYKNKDTELTYKASTNKLGGYYINDSITALLDISDYETDTTVTAIRSSGLDDDEDYKAYVYAKNSSDSSYQLILIEAEGNGFTTDSEVVVYSKYGTTNTDDGEKTTIYAYANGESTTTSYLLDDDVEFVTGYSDFDVVDGKYECKESVSQSTNIPYAEGDLLILKTNTSGEVTKVVPMFNKYAFLKGGYNTVYQAAIASETALEDVIAPANGFAYKYFANKTKSKDQVEFKFGPIVDKSDKEITIGEYNAPSSSLPADGSTYLDNAGNAVTKTYVTDVDTLDDLSYDSDVRVYVYNYNNGNNYRVSAGAKGSVVKTQLSNANCLAYRTKDANNNDVIPTTTSDKTLIDWTSFATTNAPTSTYGVVNYAFVKLVDDDVTEVYVITPSSSRK